MATKIATKAQAIADALIAADQKIMVDHANSIATKQGYLDRAVEMGEKAASGALSLMDMALDFSAAVADKALTQEDGERVYLAYAQGYNRVMETSIGGGAPLPTDKKGAAASISTFKTFGLPYAVEATQVDDFYVRIATVYGSVPSERRKSVYQSFVAANRKVGEAFKLARNEKPALGFTEWYPTVTDDHIATWIMSKVSVDKSTLDKLAEIIAKLAKVAKEPGFDLLNGQDQKLLTIHAMIAKGMSAVSLEKSEGTTEGE